MVTEVDNLLLEPLKSLRNELRDFRAQHERDMDDLRARLSHLDQSMVGVKRDQVGQFEDAARQQVSIDSLATRIARIEQRLELS